jgi:hypothetical protein
MGVGGGEVAPAEGSSDVLDMVACSAQEIVEGADLGPLQTIQVEFLLKYTAIFRTYTRHVVSA